MRPRSIAWFVVPFFFCAGAAALGALVLRSLLIRPADGRSAVAHQIPIDMHLVVDEDEVSRPVQHDDLTRLSHRERLEKIAPRAAGIAEVDVTGIEQFDTRPQCGALYLKVSFRVLRSTGWVSDYVNITLAADNPLYGPYKPYGPVKRDTFATGKRYWVAFSSKYDYQRYPQQVVKAWPEKTRPDDLEEAVRTDAYHECPEYHPESGLTPGHRAETDKKSWQAFVECDGKRLWERTVPGMIDENWHNSYYVYDRARSNELRQIDGPKWLLSAMTTCHLELDNPYSYPAGDVRMMYALDVETGKVEVIWVSCPNCYPPAHPGVIQFFDLKTGNVRREERYGSLATGNLEEKERRQLVRTFDPVTGKLQSEEMRQLAPGPNGGEYVPLDNKALIDSQPPSKQ